MGHLILRLIWRPVALMLAALMLFLRGRASAGRQQTAGYRDTRRRMDDADLFGDDPDAARRWLRERARGRP